MPTRIIDNFTGRLTRNNEGGMNSGLAKYDTTFGNDPFSKVGNLSWLETPVAILSTNLGTGPVVAMKSRVEGDTNYVYAITTLAVLYKIQVNNTGTKNPDYDNPTVLATLLAQFPTVLKGGSIQFYGSTEKLFIGHDAGVTKINFDGSGETFIGSLGSYVASVPRPSVNFLGKLYFANGNNIVEIDSTETVTSYTKLSPGFPSGTYVRDLDVTPDGNYLQITVSRLNATQLDGLVIDTVSAASVDSYRFLWNGIDDSYTTYESFNGYALTSNSSFGSNNYSTGYGMGGAVLYSGSQKIISLPGSFPPNFGAMFSTGNLLGFAAPEYETSTDQLKGSIYFYGQYDKETPAGLFRFLRQTAVTGHDVIVMQACTTVSNLFRVPPFYNYANNIGGTAKVYFSTTEIVQSGGLQVYYTLFRFTLVPTGSGTSIGGVYETQQETSFNLLKSLVAKKFKPTAFRLYTEPLVANNSFKVDFIGKDGSPISGGTKTFTVGDNVTAGQDYVWFTPATAPTYSMGLRFTNLGTKNWVGVKAEIDYEESGQ